MFPQNTTLVLDTIEGRIMASGEGLARVLALDVHWAAVLLQGFRGPRIRKKIANAAAANTPHLHDYFGKLNPLDSRRKRNYHHLRGLGVLLFKLFLAPNRDHVKD